MSQKLSLRSFVLSTFSSHLSVVICQEPHYCGWACDLLALLTQQQGGATECEDLQGGRSAFRAQVSRLFLLELNWWRHVLTFRENSGGGTFVLKGMRSKGIARIPEHMSPSPILLWWCAIRNFSLFQVMLHFWSGRARACSSASTHAGFLPIAARCNKSGGRDSLSASTSAPPTSPKFLIMSSKTSTFPDSAASWTGVQPSRSSRLHSGFVWHSRSRTSTASFLAVSPCFRRPAIRWSGVRCWPSEASTCARDSSSSSASSGCPGLWRAMWSGLVELESEMLASARS